MNLGKEGLDNKHSRTVDIDIAVHDSERTSRAFDLDRTLRDARKASPCFDPGKPD